MWTLLALALASPRTQLAPDPRRSIGPTAHVLDRGEVLLGTSGLHVGVLPSVQLGTRPLLDAVAIPNGQLKIEAVRTAPFSLAVHGGGAGVAWGDLRGHAANVGATATLVAGPALSLHLGSVARTTEIEGVPTAPPAVLADWVDVSALQELGALAAQQGVVPRFQHATTEVRGTLEVRVNRRDSFLLSGRAAVWGENQSALLPGLPAAAIPPTLADVDAWLGDQGAAGAWAASLTWQLAFGNADVRVGGGASSAPGTWVGMANGVDLRAFGATRKAERAQVVAARQVKRAAARAAALPHAPTPTPTVAAAPPPARSSAPPNAAAPIPAAPIPPTAARPAGR